MDHYNLEPDVKGAGLILVAAMFFLLIFTIAFGAWAFFKEGQPDPVDVASEEGEAKAAMIMALTGIELKPEIAKWADVTFSVTRKGVE